jgi:hypothetical protein
LYGKYDALQQRRSMPVSISALVSIEGTNNFKDKYAPAVGAAISRQFGTRSPANVHADVGAQHCRVTRPDRA